MEYPRLTTPEGAFNYLILVMLLAALFFGVVFALLYYGVVPL